MEFAETPLKGKGGVLSDRWQGFRVGVAAGKEQGNLFSPLSHDDGCSDGSVDDEGFGSRASPPRRSLGDALLEPAAADDASDTLENYSAGAAPRGASFTAQRLPTEPLQKPPDTSSISTLRSISRYIMHELSWGYGLTPRKRVSAEHVLNFLRITIALEPFLSFGHLLCIDVFLFHFTLLPLRCAAAVCTGISAAVRALFCAAGCTSCRQPTPFLQAHAYDLIKGALLITAASVLGAVQVSRVYHYIRGEAIIKLYVIFNILEIFDRLACSLGQDVMDGLYRVTRDHLTLGSMMLSRSALLRVSFHFAIAVLYVVGHALILFVQIVCLNVAINSRNNALFTLLISNNFMELKASVFKKFEAENLFQVSCSDAVERFQLGLFLVLIGVQELRSTSAVFTLLSPMVAIYICEMIVDYVKHSFITKFNRLHSDLYGTFNAILAHDFVAVRTRMGASLDPTHSSVKRLGLAALPLAVVTHRMLLLRFGSPEGGASTPLSVRAARSAAGGDAPGSAAALDALLDSAVFSTTTSPLEVGTAAVASASGAYARLLNSVTGALPTADNFIVFLLIFLSLFALKAALSMGLLAMAARIVRAQKNQERGGAMTSSSALPGDSGVPGAGGLQGGDAEQQKRTPRSSGSNSQKTVSNEKHGVDGGANNGDRGEPVSDDDAQSVDSAAGTIDRESARAAAENTLLHRLVHANRYDLLRGRVPI